MTKKIKVDFDQNIFSARGENRVAGLNAGIGAAPRHRAAVMTRTRRQNERERGRPCVPLDAMKFKRRCHNTSTVVYKGVPHDTLYRSHAVAFAREAYHF